jgi:hypothetical protein
MFRCLLASRFSSTTVGILTATSARTDVGPDVDQTDSIAARRFRHYIVSFSHQYPHFIISFLPSFLPVFFLVFLPSKHASFQPSDIQAAAEHRNDIQP